MRIVVTGSSGFIGSYFIKNSPEFEIASLNLRLINPDDFDFSGYDAVLHLAAMVHQKKETSYAIYNKINCDLAYDVARNAKEQSVKCFILMSTVKVYGSSAGSLDENSVCNPVDGYGKSKLAGERKVSELSDVNFKVAIVRTPLVYGPGVKANMYNLLRLVDKLPVLPLAGISNLRSMVYVGNLVQLIKNILNIRAEGVFLAADRYAISTTSLAIMMNQNLGKKHLFFKLPSSVLTLIKSFKPGLYDRLFGSFVVDNRSTNLKLSYSPKYSVEEGVKEMVEWYKSVQ